MHVLSKTRYDAVMQLYGNLADALPQVGEPFLKALGCRDEGVRDALMRLEEFDVGRYEARLHKAGIRFLCIDDSDYPLLLRQLPDPPVFLYAQGDLSLCQRPSVALVGTREMTKYGRHATQLLTGDIVAAGLVTVSGLAHGVDTVVAEETLQAGGKHIAVLGHGLGRIYPAKNAELARDIVKQGGLILSEFPLDFPAGQYTFPARNRLIAGLSRGTVVCEAPAKSGALITAEFALEQNREVFAVPGPITEPTYAGCNRLIARGQAKLVTCAADILEELGVVVPEASAKEFLSEDPVQRAVWAALSQLPLTGDDLVQKLSLQPPAVGAALTMMELSGAVRSVEGGRWVRA